MSKSVNSIEYDRFRELLRSARISAGVSQADLAKALDQPQSVISKIERGERRIDVVEFVKVARVLDLDASQLIRDFAQTLDQST
ncbi:MAG: XRE family transcriptional regulator [Alphaproteobacteria bacterium]|nr:MAG: XRE family transcriptional regulator [Alphaproteobacteria bacterium]